RAVAGINRDHSHSRHLRFVFDEGAELVERPGMQRGPLGLPSPNPSANAFELFQGNRSLRALSLDHQSLADRVVDLAGEPPLLATASLEQTLGRPGVESLQP